MQGSKCQTKKLRIQKARLVLQKLERHALSGDPEDMTDSQIRAAQIVVSKGIPNPIQKIKQQTTVKHSGKVHYHEI